MRVPDELRDPTLPSTAVRQALLLDHIELCFS